MEINEITEDVYNKITQKLSSKFGLTYCKRCKGLNKEGDYINLQFPEFEKFDGMFKFQCILCGYTELFEPEFAITFEP